MGTIWQQNSCNTINSNAKSQVFSSHCLNSQSSQFDDVYKSKNEHELSCIFEDSPVSKPVESQKYSNQTMEQPKKSLYLQTKESDESEVSGAEENQLSSSTIISDRSNLPNSLNIGGTPYKFFVYKPGLNRN